MQVVNRNNVVAGLFLLLSVLLAVAISFLLTDITDKFGEKKTYVVRFPTSVGVTGLKPGASVTFGGFDVGKVNSIVAHTQVDEHSGSRVVIAHDVTVSLISDLVLFEDAFADLSLPMLGGVSSINIPSAGTGPVGDGSLISGTELSGTEFSGTNANGVLEEGEILRGRFAPSILTQLGFSTEDAEKIQATIDEVKEISTNANEVTKGFRRMTETLEPSFVEGVDDGKSTMANVRAFTENLNGEDGWSTKVGGILTNADEASGKVSATIDDANTMIGDARGLIAESRPRVARILENVEETTERVRFDSIQNLNDLLAKGSIALGSYQDVATKVSVALDDNRPKIDATLDSVERISSHGELFLQEIRSQPWRLLSKPSKDELEREPIYEAARAYADAVSDLRIASEALDAAVARMATTGGSPASAAELARISGVVESAYGRYEEAEHGLLERLRTPSP